MVYICFLLFISLSKLVLVVTIKRGYDLNEICKHFFFSKKANTCTMYKERPRTKHGYIAINKFGSIMGLKFTTLITMIKMLILSVAFKLCWHYFTFKFLVICMCCTYIQVHCIIPYVGVWNFTTNFLNILWQSFA